MSHEWWLMTWAVVSYYARLNIILRRVTSDACSMASPWDTNVFVQIFWLSVLISSSSFSSQIFIYGISSAVEFRKEFYAERLISVLERRLAFLSLGFGTWLLSWVRSQNCENWQFSFVTSVRPHETTRLPLDGFWRNLVIEFLSKICRENSSFVKIWQE